MSEPTNSSSEPIRLIFPTHNTHARVITLWKEEFSTDKLCNQADISQMRGRFVNLTGCEAISLINRIEYLENKFRPKKQSYGEEVADSSLLSRREVIEFALRDVFAGVQVQVECKKCRRGNNGKRTRRS